MIFLDANVFLRLFEEATSPASRLMKSQARHLFASVARGEVLVTTSEVVLHEVCYILGSKSHYGKPAAEIIGRMQTVLGWPGMQFPGSERDIYLRALDLWSQHPKLEFADSVIAARCERAGHELATFDRHVAAIPSLTLWQPQVSAPE